MARLSTHVLDTSRGVPAAGMHVSLHWHGDGARRCLATAVTNADGRTDTPLLDGELLNPPQYELQFHAGDYFRAQGVTLPSTPVFDVIVIRVGIADPNGRYHIPLLLSPYGYSTYRGS